MVLFWVYHLNFWTHLQFSLMLLEVCEGMNVLVKYQFDSALKRTRSLSLSQTDSSSLNVSLFWFTLGIWVSMFFVLILGEGGFQKKRFPPEFFFFLKRFLSSIFFFPFNSKIKKKKEKKKKKKKVKWCRFSQFNGSP